jgi:hypothetical protein
MLGNSCEAEKLTASQQGLKSMELVSYLVSRLITPTFCNTLSNLLLTDYPVIYS